MQKEIKKILALRKAGLSWRAVDADMGWARAAHGKRSWNLIAGAIKAAMRMR